MKSNDKSKNRIIPSFWIVLLIILVALFLLFLIFFNLNSYPQPWFDEGSHLHVPKTLVLYGVYADISSEGFRYYGPTVGVGPTVMLPIAGMFKLFGIGFLQARFIMALYLIATIFVFYRLVQFLAGNRTAFVATALLISTRSVLLITYGRQVLGEVPALLFVLVGILVWFNYTIRSGLFRLIFVGILFGLSMITKYQFVIFIAPAIGLAWLLNLIYYKHLPQKFFILPGVTSIICFFIWQTISTIYLGPETIVDNFSLLLESASGAAFKFSITQMITNLETLTARAVYLGSIIPALAYAIILSLPKSKEGQRWGMLLIFVAVNLVWYVVASIGWVRYYFFGLAVASIIIARFFSDITDGFRLRPHKFDKGQYINSLINDDHPYRWAFLLWLIVLIFFPLSKTIMEVASINTNYAEIMAAYLDENVPENAIIETWDPEMGFFSNHNYHYPPNHLLSLAVEQVYGYGEPVKEHYEYMQKESPEYLLIGEFSNWVDIYPIDEVSEKYELVTSFGDYYLYKLIDQ